MKKHSLLLTCLLLACLTSFGQKTYKIADSDLTSILKNDDYKAKKSASTNSMVKLENAPLTSNTSMRALETAVLKEVNIVRANPKQYAQKMRKLEFRSFGDENYSRDFINYSGHHFWGCSDASCKSKYMQKLNAAINYLENLDVKLGALKENRALNKASEYLAADKGQIDGPGHRDSNGRDPWQRGTAAGYSGDRYITGEVLGGGSTPATVVIGFLTSPGHRDILMSEAPNEIGIDAHNHGDYIRAVMITGNDRALAESQNTDDPCGPLYVRAWPKGFGTMNRESAINESEGFFSENMKFVARINDQGKLVLNRVIGQGKCNGNTTWHIRRLWVANSSKNSNSNNAAAQGTLAFTAGGDLCYKSSKGDNWCLSQEPGGAAVVSKAQKVVITNEGVLQVQDASGKVLWSVQQN